MPVNVEGTVNLAVELATGQVKRGVDPLKIDVGGFRYDVGGNRGTFDGAVAQSVTASSTNYVYLSDAGTLQINTTGFPTGVPFIPLARVVCSSSDVTNIYEERTLLGSSSAASGTCRIGFPVDAGIRGDGSSTSSNNDIASITFPEVAGTNPRNRWMCRPPQNYISGDLTLHLLCSVAGTPGNTKVRWVLEWGFLSDGDALPSSYPYSTALSKDMNSISNDTLFSVNLTIPAANFDKTKEMMYFWLYRNCDHADDNCTLTQHVHLIGLNYTGYTVAGQAGQ